MMEETRLLMMTTPTSSEASEATNQCDNIDCRYLYFVLLFVIPNASVHVCALHEAL